MQCFLQVLQELNRKGSYTQLHTQIWTYNLMNSINYTVRSHYSYYDVKGKSRQENIFKGSSGLIHDE